MEPSRFTTLFAPDSPAPNEECKVLKVSESAAYDREGGKQGKLFD